MRTPWSLGLSWAHNWAIWVFPALLQLLTHQGQGSQGQGSQTHLPGTKEVSRAMRTPILVLLPPELGPSVLLSTQSHRSSWQGMVHGHGGAQLRMEGPAQGAPGRRQRAAGYHRARSRGAAPAPAGKSSSLRDEAFPCVSLPLEVLELERKCREPALPAAVLGRVLVSPVVCFGLELALVQQGQQLGDLLQGRKSLLSPGLATQAASCQDIPPSPPGLFIAFPPPADGSASPHRGKNKPWAAHLGP